MNHSIITEYQEDLQQFSPAGLSSQYVLSKSPEKQAEDPYSNKLEIKIKQIKNNIKKNKPVIEQLKAQRKFLKKIYEKQKQKIQGSKIELIKTQYENQIQLLRHQRHKLQDVISVIHEESNSKARDFVEAKEEIKQNFNQLSKALEEIRNQNKMYEEMIMSKTQSIDLKTKQIADIMSQIKGKVNVERKYKEIMNEVQQAERSKLKG